MFRMAKRVPGERCASPRYPVMTAHTVPSQLACSNGRHGSRKRGRFEGRSAVTGMYDQVRPGIGHNQPEEFAEEKKHERWERWAKKRTFVRALAGTYSLSLIHI